MVFLLLYQNQNEYFQRDIINILTSMIKNQQKLLCFLAELCKNL
jgi:hypothetical protein